MGKKRKGKIRAYVKTNKFYVIALTGIFVFPLFIGAIYALPLPQFIAVGSGDLLAYYGVCFGIIGSFCIYRMEKERSINERKRFNKPQFIVEVSKIQDSIFTVRVKNRSQNRVRYLNLYDEFISADVLNEYEFKVSYWLSDDDLKKFEDVVNITMDPDIIDKDGYPKYVQLVCNDMDDNTWNCCFFKVKDCGKIFYYPRDVEIV